MARRDRNGNRTSYAYDKQGRLTVITDATGRTDRYLYTGGRLSSVRDEAGRETAFAYDAAGRLTAVTYPDPDAVAGNGNTPVERFEYDANGRLTAYRARGPRRGRPGRQPHHDLRVRRHGTLPPLDQGRRIGRGN